ncbi:Hypothetical predicted protein [Mytilus galloprovincialis]|uniref:Kringle domain-containing protein n=1 Tax=Mytilus galloprovincialis TaxID=29158 RepID=A0A8B6D1H3_MYTGA|nr:Hypothetical predicted protein [Mytilus galloprovincialis]
MDTRSIAKAFIFTVIHLKHIASLRADCLDNHKDVQSYKETTSVTNTGKTCQRWDTDYPHIRRYRYFSEHHNYCRAPDYYPKLWCYTMDENTRWEYCDICGLSTETVAVTNTQATSATSVAGIGHTDRLSTEVVTVINTQTTSEMSVSTGRQQTDRMRPRKLLCKCPKRLINKKWHNLDGKNITHSEVKEKVLEDFNKNIKSEISVDKKTVTKEVRKKISSVNKRTSSQSIGWGCIVFLVIPMIFLIAIDILNCYIHFHARCGKKQRNRVSAISVIQDQEDSTNPLPENVDTTKECSASGSCNNLHPGEMELETCKKSVDNKQKNGEEWFKII